VGNQSDNEQGIANRGKGAEEPGQDVVLDMVSDMERKGARDDLNTDERIEAGQEGWQQGRNIESDTTEGGRPTGT
jgi:hypothetical protein